MSKPETEELPGAIVEVSTPSKGELREIVRELKQIIQETIRVLKQ